MKLGLLFAGVAAVGFMSGCTSDADKVTEARQDLQETRQEAVRDASEAQTEAVRDINAVKEDGAKDIQAAQEDLRDAQSKAAADLNDGSVSGTTSAGHDAKPSMEECAKLAAEKPVKPENKAKYDACQKRDSAKK